MKNFTPESMNPNTLKAQYAVRGAIVIRAGEIDRELKAGQHSYPFDNIVFCNIGNPQQLGQKPITFFRNVLSLVTSPELIQNQSMRGIFKEDVFNRAENILNMIDSRSTGAYTHSQGLLGIRQNVANFIKQRDDLQVEISPDYIFLTDGASPGVQGILRALITDEKDAVLVPIPQYPLYSAAIQLLGGTMVGYYLDEQTQWSLDITELSRQYQIAVEKGLRIKALVIINPGNPTGNFLTKDNMQDIVLFCEKYGILLMADEVYQENVYGERPFYSFNRVVSEMGKLDSFEMVSFHSVSKGFLGECGRRGGYYHLSPAIDRRTRDQLYKLASINLCPNVDGQIMIDLMVNPPKQGDASYEEYITERDAIINSLKRRAEKLVNTLNTMEGVSCQKADGAMYAFPSITIPKAAVLEAQQRGIQPDALYAFELLENAGLCAVPGSGFGQKDGTYHFRTTFLPPEDKMDVVTERMKHFHANFMLKYKD